MTMSRFSRNKQACSCTRDNPTFTCRDPPYPTRNETPPMLLEEQALVGPVRGLFGERTLHATLQCPSGADTVHHSQTIVIPAFGGKTQRKSL